MTDETGMTIGYLFLIFKHMLKKILDYLLMLFLFLLPWQTRWFYQSGSLNGGYWEYGTFSLYGTQILLWLIIILFAAHKFGRKEFWTKVLSREHFKTHRFNLLFGLLTVSLLAFLPGTASIGKFRIILFFIF